MKNAVRDVDLLMLIREEEVYASRIREALVFTEKRIERPQAVLLERDLELVRERRALYTRPMSIAQQMEDEAEILDQGQTPKRCRSIGRPKRAPLIGGEAELADAITVSTFINPPVMPRRTVQDNDALYSEATPEQRALVKFTYADLIAARENRSNATVRTLRKLANLWRRNPKLNREGMLTELIAEYARRYPEEVKAYEEKRSATGGSRSAHGRRPRRQGRRAPRR